MIPVLCIGETKEEFDANLCESVCAIQLAKDLAGVSAADVKTMIIAYEPVWAIGTGLVCPSETAQKVHKFLRAKIAAMYDEATADAVRIQYGGSVTPDSVDELMSMPDIDGCLVGGASCTSRTRSTRTRARRRGCGSCTASRCSRATPRRPPLRRPPP